MAFYVLYAYCGISDMLDGFVARKTHSESKLGERLDSVSDIVFVAVCFIKIFPNIEIPFFVWIWCAVIALIRLTNVCIGWTYQHKVTFLHTILNKVTGALLFLLPFTLSFIELKYSAGFACVVATVASVDESIRLIKKSPKSS